MKTDLFLSCGHRWVFQNCWHIECSAFTASSFRIWNSSTGIPLPPLAFLVVMLSKAHLTAQSRMPGSRWMITMSWISGPLRSFLSNSYVHSCHLFSISPTYVRSHSIFILYWAHLSMKCSLGISNFLEEIPTLSHSVVSSISSHWSLRKAFSSLLAILWNSAFRWEYLSFSPLPFTSLLFSAICEASSDSHFAFFHFFFLGMVLITSSCTMLWTSIHSSSGTVYHI